MTRVSENSKNAVLNYNLSRVKKKLEGLQIRGASLKKIVKPSDDPSGNIDLLTLRSQLTDNKQFIRNLNYSRSYLELTENAISDLSNVLVRAKEIAIRQSSDIFSPEIRKNVAKEVDQLLNESWSIANRRIGNKYMFSGYATHQRPFNEKGMYLGDDGHQFIEIKKEFFVPINLTGLEVFFNTENTKALKNSPLEETPFTEQKERPSEQGPKKTNRGIASSKKERQKSIFGLLKGLRDSLLRGSSSGVQNLLEELDQASSRLITLRTQVGAVYNSLSHAETTISDDNLVNMDYKSKIEDADITNLFSELEKQNNTLQAAYKSGAFLINKSLLDFLR